MTMVSMGEGGHTIKEEKRVMIYSFIDYVPYIELLYESNDELIKQMAWSIFY